MTGDELKKLAALTGEKPPIRKADMADLILRYLEGERLCTVWESLDELQRTAVAEVVHSDSDQLSDSQFRAKYAKPDHAVRPQETAQGVRAPAPQDGGCDTR